MESTQLNNNKNSPINVEWTDMRMRPYICPRTLCSHLLHRHFALVTQTQEPGPVPARWGTGRGGLTGSAAQP